MTAPLAGLAFGGWSLACRLATPLLRRYMAQRLARGKEDPQRLEERWGHASRPRPPGPLVWLHGASVGEVISALPLLRALGRDHPNLTLLITSGTVTSAKIAATRLAEGVIHQFLPIDHPAAVARFYRHWRPNLGLLVESELWPNLLRQAQRRNLPLVLLNARLSARSFGRWQRFAPVSRALMQPFQLVLAQSRQDAERYRALGARKAMAVGNLKFAASPLPHDPRQLADWQRRVENRPIWLAASTHPGEESCLAQVHLSLKADHPKLLTLMVPRHPERGAQLAEELRAQGLTVTRQALGETPDPRTDIHLGDTLGDLGLWYRLSPLAFIGGSLVAHGGQNPLEAARLNAALLMGPHSHNFTEIVALLSADRALTEVADQTELEAALRRFLAEPALAAAQAGRAARLLDQQGRALEETLAALHEVLAGQGLT